MKKITLKIKAAVMVEHKNKLLLIKEFDANKKMVGWNVVKGTFNPSRDKTPLDAAIFINKRSCLLIQDWIRGRGKKNRGLPRIEFIND